MTLPEMVEPDDSGATALQRQIMLLRPRRGDVVAITADLDGGDDEQSLAEQLSQLADLTKATFLLMPTGTTLEELDEREMLARGWLKVGVRAHTTEEL